MHSPQPYVEKNKQITNAGTAVVFDSQIVPPGEAWVLDFLCFTNNSGEAVAVTVAVYDGTRSITILQATALADGAPLVPTLAPTLFEGDRLRATVTGTANKSNVTLYFTATRYQIGGRTA